MERKLVILGAVLMLMVVAVAGPSTYPPVNFDATTPVPNFKWVMSLAATSQPAGTVWRLASGPAACCVSPVNRATATATFTRGGNYLLVFGDYRVVVNCWSWPGDFNGDTRVDQGDYPTWADHFLQGDETLPKGSSNDDGVIDQADYTMWADNFGRH